MGPRWGNGGGTVGERWGNGVGFCRDGLTEKIKKRGFQYPVRDRKPGIGYSVRWTEVSGLEYGSKKADLFGRPLGTCHSNQTSLPGLLVSRPSQMVVRQET